MVVSDIPKERAGGAPYCSEKTTNTALAVANGKHEALKPYDHASGHDDTSYRHRLWLVKYSHTRAAGAAGAVGAAVVLGSPGGLLIGPLLYAGRTLGKAYCMKETMEDKKNLQIELKSFTETIISSDDHYQLYKTAEQMTKRKGKFVEHNMTREYLKWTTAANYKGLAIEYSETRSVVTDDTEGAKLAHAIASDCKALTARTYRYWPNSINLLVIGAKRRLQKDIQATRSELDKGLPQEAVSTIRHQLGAFFEQNFPVEDRAFFKPDYLSQDSSTSDCSCRVQDGTILAEIFEIMLLCFAKERDLSVPGLIDGREAKT